MIRPFRSKDTETLAKGNRVKQFAAFERAAQRKLEMLDAATSLEDLKVPPGNRLERLSRNRTGQYSIRINEQWRICSEWSEGAHNVEIVDYHQERKTTMARLNPVHPGEILTEEFLSPLGITRNKLAIDLGIPASRIDQIAKGKRSISADTALRLSFYFKTSPQFWMNLQSSYDLKSASARLPEIRRQVRPAA